MIARSFFRRLHGAALRAQLAAVLAVVPLAAALYGVAVAPVIVDAAMRDASAEARGAASAAMLLVVAAMLASVCVATVGAAMVLRGSLRAVVERMLAATRSIADGDFTHRIDASRGDELGRLADSIDTMAARLERLEEARRRLLACVSHELRTPLTIVRGHAFTLARGEHDGGRRARIELIEDEAARLAGLIDDLMDASSLHAGSVRLRIERCDLASIVAGAVARFEAAAVRRGVHLEARGIERELVVDADPARLDQVLANLLANAVRHAEPGSTVELALAARRGMQPRYLTIANRGAAIPAELVPRVFEPFTQSSGGDGGRLGLGLTIAHGLAVAHGGALTLESSGRLSGVVEFRLMLPAPARVAPDREHREVRRGLPARRARPAGLRLVETP